MGPEIVLAWVEELVVVESIAPRERVNVVSEPIVPQLYVASDAQAFVPLFARRLCSRRLLGRGMGCPTGGVTTGASTLAAGADGEACVAPWFSSPGRGSEGVSGRGLRKGENRGLASGQKVP